MESVSTRRSSIEDHGGGASSFLGGLSNSLLEPATHHDVMSVEMSHHEMGGTYLDPRSFGGSGSFDEFTEPGVAFELSSAPPPPSSASYEAAPSRLFTIQSNQGSTIQVKFESQHSTSSSSLHQSPSLHPSPSLSHSQSHSLLQSSSSSPFVHNGTSSQSTHPGMLQRSSAVPTYPVKTYAPGRSVLSFSMKPQSRRTSAGGRSATKKEPLDPKRVDDEVARNVSQILMATKQSKLQQEAQQRNGLLPHVSRASYCCPDCGRSMTSQRNLQRHRQTSCAKKMGSSCSPEMSRSSGNSLSRTDSFYEGTSNYSSMGGRGREGANLPSMDTFGLMNNQQQGHEPSMDSFDMHSPTDWCPSDSFGHSLSRDRVDSNEHLAPLDPSSLPLSLSDHCIPPMDPDDNQTLSSSASQCSSQSNSGGHSTPQGIYTCDSCKKTVCSLRSLKRHHTTCKQFIADYGPPADSDLKAPSSTPMIGQKRGARKVPTPPIQEDTPSSPSSDNCLQPPPDPTSSPSPSPAPSESSPSSLQSPRETSSSPGLPTRRGSSSNRMPKPPGTHNTCLDCNRQLCSASNLKRHRATCKVAIQKMGGPISPQPLIRSTSFPPVDIPANERSIIDRSYAAALAATEQARHRAPVATTPAASSSSSTTTTTTTSSLPSSAAPVGSARSSQSEKTSSSQYLLNTEPIYQQKPWITVGEHLRAQHVQQKMFQAASHHQMTSPEEEEEVDRYRAEAPTVDYAMSDEKPSLDEDDCGDLVGRHLASAESSGSSDDMDGLEDIDLEAFNEDMLIREEEEQRLQQEAEDREREQADDRERSRETERQQMESMTSQSGGGPLSSTVKIEEIPMAPSSAATQYRPPAAPATAIPPLESIITTKPLEPDNRSRLLSFPPDRRLAPPPRIITSSNSEFQCPECKKTYSCRKNVKRHRMAVHKLSNDDVTRYPGPAPCPTAVQISNNPGLSPIPRSGSIIPRVDAKADYKTELVPLPPAPAPPPQIRYQTKSIDEGYPNWGSSTFSRRDYLSDDETTETARIAAELKRSAEMAESEGKRPHTELAEADTTFNEDGESMSAQSLHSSPGSSAVTSSMAGGRRFSAQSASTAGPILPAMGHWATLKREPLSVDIPSLSVSRSAASSPAASFRRRAQFICETCNRVLSSDYSLRRHRQNCGEQTTVGGAESLLGAGDAQGQHGSVIRSCDPMLGHGPSSLPRPFTECGWFRREEMPDSTTHQRQDRGSSPGCLMDQSEVPPLGALPYTRKRALSGGSTGGYSNDPKQARHLCQFPTLTPPVPSTSSSWPITVVDTPPLAPPSSMTSPLAGAPMLPDWICDDIEQVVAFLSHLQRI